MNKKVEDKSITSGNVHIKVKKVVAFMCEKMSIVSLFGGMLMFCLMLFLEGIKRNYDANTRNINFFILIFAFYISALIFSSLGYWLQKSKKTKAILIFLVVVPLYIGVAILILFVVGLIVLMPFWPMLFS